MAVIGWQKLKQVLASSSCGVSWSGLPSLLGRAEWSLPTDITAQCHHGPLGFAASRESGWQQQQPLGLWSKPRHTQMAKAFRIPERGPKEDAASGSPRVRGPFSQEAPMPGSG